MRLVSKDDIAAANKEIESLRKHLVDIEKDLEHGEKIMEDLNSKYSDQKDKFSEKNDEFKSFQKESESLQSQLDAVNSNINDKEKELKEAEGSEASEEVIKSIKQEIEALDKSREPISDKLEDAKQGVLEAEKEMKDIEAELESTSKEIDDVSNDHQKKKEDHRDVSNLLEEKLKNETLARYEEERAERLEMIEDAFEERERINSILRNDHTDISSEKEDRESDRSVIRAELRDQLGIESGEGGDSIVKGILSNLTEHGADHELGIFPANEALGLSRNSIFSANLHGITDKIKAACKKGATKIIVTEKEITGPIMYALIEVGYNVSHEKRYNPGRNESTQNVIIDWAFPYSAGKE
tara:strand:+ start:112 stop:1176 length:1065 start_codon:yes stop_codon:yes gene_type:complete